MIIAKGLTKNYGKFTALDDVSFTIESGEAVALWGANGAGKTTTLRCLLGVHGFEGELSVNGIDVQRNGRAARAAIGYVPQESAFYDMTLLETLHFYARLRKTRPERVAEVLEHVQLSEHGSRRVNMLSGGMKQRLALAVALLSDPPVLILDEPTANLDVAAQSDFIQTVQRLNHGGKTILFCSHRLDEVTSLGTRVLVLAQGKLALECPPHELASRLGMRQWLRIWVPAPHKEPAARVLEEHGYSFSPNGRSIYVQVNPSEKAAPLRTLALSSIPVEDFDLVDEVHALKETHHD